MAYAASLQIPMWTTEPWLRFVEARAATQIANTTWSAVDRTLTFSITVPAGAEAQTVLVPATFGGDTVTAVAVDGQHVAAPAFVVNGQSLRAIVVAPAAGGAPRQIAVLFAVPNPTVAIADVSVSEGHSAPRWPASPSRCRRRRPIRSRWRSRPPTTTATITVAFRDDVLNEAKEAFYVDLSGATNVTIAKARGIATITDADPVPGLSINDVSTTEGWLFGSKSLVFTVSLSVPSGRAVSVAYATANGTATSGSDYTAKSGTVSIPRRGHERHRQHHGARRYFQGAERNHLRQPLESVGRHARQGSAQSSTTTRAGSASSRREAGP